MKTYTESELKEILRLHKLWLAGRSGGVRADLSETDLRGANLRGANLEEANLYGADLRGANLRGATLYWADLRGANLRGANLRGANLEEADLEGANLEGANLYEANLYEANLSSTKGVKTFKYEQHLAVQYLNRIRIGCKDATIAQWVREYRKIGLYNNYTSEQIEAYGKFIKQCEKEMK